MKKVIKVLCFPILILVIIALVYLYINKMWIFNPYRNVLVEPEKIITKLEEEFELNSCYEMNEEEVKEKYYIEDASQISSFSVLSSYIGLEAEEIAIFKLNDKSQMKDFKENIVKRAKDIIKYYEGYSYTQTEVSKDYDIKEYNDTLVFIIHKNKDKIIKYIEKIILENGR